MKYLCEQDWSRLVRHMVLHGWEVPPMPTYLHEPMTEYDDLWVMIKIMDQPMESGEMKIHV